MRRVSAHWWHYEAGHWQYAPNLYEETALSFPRNAFLMELYER